MSKKLEKNEYSLSIIAIVGIVSTSLTICFLSLHNFNFKVIIDKEKIEVTAYNFNSKQTNIDM